MTSTAAKQAQHTPGPWTLFYRGNAGWRFSNGAWSFDCNAIGCDKAAAHDICDRLNAHDDLVAALRAIVKITDGSQPIDYPGALMVARTALAKVQS